MAGCIRNHPGIPQDVILRMAACRAINFVGLIDQLDHKYDPVTTTTLSTLEEVPKEYLHPPAEGRPQGNLMDILLEASKAADGMSLRLAGFATEYSLFIKREQYSHTF